ncbi:hypothetical protein [Streptomyces sp. IBSBF 2435]|uniref:hypothetical protein n=1 Tax=Streptomyces sp. IBSBF 2435 TaxID=2903531 RepID=UPI002FDBAF9E
MRGHQEVPTGGPAPADDAMTSRIGQVVMLLHAGDREEARHRFTALWAELGEQGDPLHRCTVAHYLADTQDDPEDELAWDLRALRAAEAVDAERAGGGGQAGQVRGFYPSLHLNLAASYVRVGEERLARSHLGLARKACGALAEDAYGDGVRAAVGRLELRLTGSGQLP